MAGSAAGGVSGASGFRVQSGGYTQSGTDLNSDIREDRGYGTPHGNAGIYHEMYQTLPAVTLLFRLFSSPIRSAPWDIRYESQAKSNPEILDRCRRAYFDDLESWDTYVAQKCQSMIYGFMPFEVEEGLANDGAVVAKRFLQRMPFSIERINRQNERLASVVQRVQTEDDQSIHDVMIPANRMLWHVHDRQGDHMTGISLLRQAYGPWKAILSLWTLAMIRMEKSATPVPALGLDNESFRDQVIKDDCADFFGNYTANEYSHLIYPLGIEGTNKIEFLGGSAPSDDIVQLIRAFEWSILSSGAGQFLALGTTSSGSRAVGDVHAKVFWRSLQAKMNELCTPINDTSDFAPAGSIKHFVDVNFGPQDVYPTLFASTPRAETMESFARSLQILNAAGFLRAVPEDHEMIRDETFMHQLTADQRDDLEEHLSNMDKFVGGWGEPSELGIGGAPLPAADDAESDDTDDEDDSEVA